jgi:uncharacterized glyoxalase superfamily protein PhnB
LRFYHALGLRPIVLAEPHYFECRDLDAVWSRLERDGLQFEQPPTDMSYLWREARLRDPDGHQVRSWG